MVLITQDPSGVKQFFAGFYKDNTVCWSTHEHVALDKTLAELKTIAHMTSLESYTIRERISVNPHFSIHTK